MEKEDNKSKLKTRRNFLNILLGISSGTFLSAIIYPIYKYLIPPKDLILKPTTVLVGKVGELKSNSAKILRFGDQPGI